MTIAPLPDGSLKLTLPGLPGRPGVLQATKDLTPPAAWTEVGAADADEGGVLKSVDPTADTASQRFYRVRIP